MSQQAQLMQGKRGLVMGVANDRSIAWGIAKRLHEQGARIGLTYQGDAMLKRVRPLAEKVDAEILQPCDVADDDSLDAAFEAVREQWGSIDFLVHAIAYADRDELKDEYVHTSREGFLRSLEISCYSFTAAAQRAVPLMNEGGSMLTLTYYGAERVMPHYNVMGVAKAALESSVRYMAQDLGDQGIRVNAVSAGPIRTLAASGIGDFRYILKWNELNSPLRRNVTQDQVGNSAVYLLSDLSSAVTGEVHHVDSGYHTVGMMAVDAAPQLAELLENLKSEPNP
ncbi:Enoyl-[acyl-carrier-protein] reductase [NADH] [Limimonas halophila]|uniref:Enoyl-[acyl-carrier-protein] reductase [NADH] n=1 Tax=Limimonas halophila TaxID=1082479 RepID=A0A1G7LDU8_9PROT|nr:enoyl-ACP reductase FabI [Limimonas halophila]SDF47571.1 Enoyl-[acyl-carrier-protein] reductase [NADH] [Limimonas halophila]